MSEILNNIRSIKLCVNPGFDALPHTDEIILQVRLGELVRRQAV